MKPDFTISETRYDVTVYPRRNMKERLQLLVVGLFFFVVLSSAVILRSTAAVWTTILFAAVPLIGLILFYHLAKPYVLEYHGYKLVRETLRRNGQLDITSLKSDGRFVAYLLPGLPGRQVHGVITFVNVEYEYGTETYRIDLLPE